MGSHLSDLLSVGTTPRYTKSLGASLTSPL